MQPSTPKLEPSPERERLIQELSGRFSPAGIRRRRLHRTVGTGLWLVWIQVLSASRRLLDIVAAALLLLVLSPLLVLLYLAARARGGGLRRTERLGRWGIVFFELGFDSGPFRHLPALWNVLRGDLAFVGPRPVSPVDVSPVDRLAFRRFKVRPGLICLWWIRQRANIAYGSESESDAEYLESQSLWNDMAIGLRAIPAAFYGGGVAAAPDQIDFLGIRIDNLSMDEAIDSMLAHAEQPLSARLAGQGTMAAFINADCVNISYRDADYREILRRSGMVLADGIGVKLAGRILNTHIRQNVNGTDLFPRLCAEMERRGTGLYLLGGQPGIAAAVADWVHAKFPQLNIRGHHHGFFKPEETGRILQEIRDSGAQILLVAFGAPRQEKWISKHLAETGVGLAMGVGGLFDFYSGRIRRAPAWVREIGMEWFYRFIQEPRRMWRRYFVGNAVFLWRVLWNRLRGGETV